MDKEEEEAIVPVIYIRFFFPFRAFDCGRQRKRVGKNQNER